MRGRLLGSFLGGREGRGKSLKRCEGCGSCEHWFLGDSQSLRLFTEGSLPWVLVACKYAISYLRRREYHIPRP